MTTNSGGELDSFSGGSCHPAALAAESLLRHCEVRRQRRSGPGGQHRNKVETAVVITHRPTGITGEASERRSQEENRLKALFRLRLNLALQVRSPAGASSASELWTRRCQQGRVVINSQHADFPGLLAEALDILEGVDQDAGRAGELLGCTPSQLIKLLQKEPRALEGVNRQRRASGKSIYR